MVEGTFRPVDLTCKAIQKPTRLKLVRSQRLVISRRERNFAGATSPGFYVDRDHHRGRDFDDLAFDGSAQFERRDSQQPPSSVAG